MKFSTYGVCLVLAVAGLAVAAVGSGGGAAAYFDLPSFLMAAVCPFLLLRGVRTFKDMGRCFAAVFSPSPDPAALADAADFFRALRRCVAAAGAVGSLIGLMAMFINLQDKNRIGANAALSCLSLFYAALLVFLVCLPMESAAAKRLAESGTGGPV